MPRYRAKAVLAKFKRLDFHDDGLKSVKVYPPLKSTSSAQIDLEFEDDLSGRTKLLSLRGCANLRYAMDFDVVGSNWFAQTQGAAATSNVERMKKLVAAQMSEWHVEYASPSPKDKPVRKKLSSLRQYVLFEVKFYGGTLEILARDFKFRRLKSAYSN